MKFLSFCAFLTICNLAISQKPIVGNGKLEEQTRPIDLFVNVDLDFAAELHIQCGSMPSLTILADENVLPQIGTKVKGKTLYITQDQWIEPSQRVELNVSTSFCTGLSTSGYSRAYVYDLDVDNFKLDVAVGDAFLEGQVKNLQINSGKGEIDASRLETENARVKVDNGGRLEVQASSSLSAEARDEAIVLYHGDKPSQFSASSNDGGQILHIDDYQPEDRGEVVYVEFKLKNNSMKRHNFYVSGRHEDGRFSYGFPISPQMTRKENWPVGTKVYLVRSLGTRSLLYTAKAEDAGKTIPLF